MVNGDGDSVLHHLNTAAANLIASAAVVGALMEMPEYDHARPGFVQRVEEVTEYLDRQVEEIQSWGGAFDDPEDERFHDV